MIKCSLRKSCKWTNTKLKLL